jgi:hypothetical protein
LAYMTVHFDTDQHAMLYRLKLGVWATITTDRMNQD